MSDKLSRALQELSAWVPKQDASPDERVIEALEKALATTTPERPGCPWDKQEEDDEQEDSGYWLPEGD